MRRVTVIDESNGGMRRRSFDVDKATPYYGWKGPATPSPRGYECLYHTATRKWVWHFEHTDGCRNESKYRFITWKEAQAWLVAAGRNQGMDQYWIRGEIS